MAAPKKRGKLRKRERVEPHGRAHIKSTFNNTIITVMSYPGLLPVLQDSKDRVKTRRLPHKLLQKVLQKMQWDLVLRVLM